MQQNNIFYQWLKRHTMYSTSNDLDQKILSMAHKKLHRGKNQRSNILHFISFSTVLVILLVTSNHYPKENKMHFSIKDPEEMIMYYNSIELMAEASELSEEEWISIEGSDE